MKNLSCDIICRDDVSKMDYLTMCIKEGMRDHCPVPFIQREFTHSFEINGHKFPGIRALDKRQYLVIIEVEV